MERRRGLGLVDVLLERHNAGRLRRRWLLVAAVVTLSYCRYALPALACWGSGHWERSVDASEFEETVGGPYSRVNFSVLVVVSLGYLSMLQCSSRLMQARLPIKNTIFEVLMVYNMTQMLLNAYVCAQLLREAWHVFRFPWGNQFIYTQESHRLGYFVWFHYHCCQLELLDTLFVVIRKKVPRTIFLHVGLRLLNMWAWFFACRYACGGDTYFPAAVNAATRAVVYAIYSLSMLSERGVPLVIKARVTELQMFQFAICAGHALFCLYTFWDMQISKAILVLYLLVMVTGLLLYTDFQNQAEGKSVRKLEAGSKVSIAFDSSGWLFCYHFGVATWLREHLVPEGMTAEEAESDKFPNQLIFSGSSGGSLVASTLSCGLNPKDCFEEVLKTHPECARNPFKLLPAVEATLRKCLPPNSYRCLSGRLRVLTTRISMKFPFFSAEVVNSFKSQEDVFHALRASCHVPFVGGLGPYCYDGHAYIDGMFWPQLLVPWKGNDADYVIRVSALLPSPSTDMGAPFPPTWWALLPPPVPVLRGLYWQGYRDAARWFSGTSETSPCWSCKSAASDGIRRRNSSRGRLASKERAEDDDATRWSEIQKLLLKKPNGEELPDLDDATGERPEKYIKLMEATMQRDKSYLLGLSIATCASVCVWGLLGWL
ncbi:ELOVL7 [Symbiodinium natans]|uniref:ELOVL7 protein n=1 Tax=Symbiodinium natans TaxID=878477 RepID=A0A812RUA8_9DINO|nr:ELOVL7 [Symbiodinium natans]